MGFEVADSATNFLWVRPRKRCAAELFEGLRQRKILVRYFAGERTEFTLKLRPTGTKFQLQVLDALQQIPYGTTCSYSDIARKIGSPRAVRAVGAANGRNPIPIIIPCHRVIGASGDLTGFGGGLPAKEALLRLELENSQFQLGS